MSSLNSTVTTEPKLTPEEEAEERRWASMCEVFNNRHRPRKAKRSTPKVDFVLKVQPVTNGD